MEDDDVARIRALMARWMGAVAVGDIAALSTMMTDDIVVIHGDGRVSRGKSAVVEELLTTLSRFHVEQAGEPDETIVAGEWAFDRARVRTRIASRADGRVTESASWTVTILRKAVSGEWRVARAIGVLTQG